MACRLFHAKPLFEPIMIHCQLDTKEHISIIQENAFESSICEMVAISSRPQCVNEVEAYPCDFTTSMLCGSFANVTLIKLLFHYHDISVISINILSSTYLSFDSSIMQAEYPCEKSSSSK